MRQADTPSRGFDATGRNVEIVICLAARKEVQAGLA